MYSRKENAPFSVGVGQTRRLQLDAVAGAEPHLQHCQQPALQPRKQGIWLQQLFITNSLSRFSCAYSVNGVHFNLFWPETQMHGFV